MEGRRKGKEKGGGGREPAENDKWDSNYKVRIFFTLTIA